MVAKFVRVDLETASVCPSDRYGSLEVRLLVDTLHHLTGLEQVVGPLEVRFAIHGAERTRVHNLPYS